jgi:hypothetical protein
LATLGRSRRRTQQNRAISGNSGLSRRLIRGRKASLHDLGERKRRRQRPDHDGQFPYEPVFAETQDVHAVELALANPSLEDERCRVAPVEALDVAEVLEHLGDGLEDRRDRIAVFVRLVNDRATKNDVGRQPRDDLRGIAGLDRFLEGLGADWMSLPVVQLPAAGSASTGASEVAK